MLRKTSRLLALIMIQAMAVLVAAFAWTILQHEVEAETVSGLARRIELNEAVDPAFVLRVASQIDNGSLADRCESRTVKAGLTVLLQRLDQLDGHRSAGAFVAALGETSAYIDHALACTPTDGNLWLRRAMVELARQAPFNQILHDLALSRQFSPAEARLLSSRYSVWNRLSAPQLAVAAPDLMADIDTICASPFLMVKLPKASLALQLFLAAQADQRLRHAAQPAQIKVARPRLKLELPGGPGLWCSQSLI